MGKRRNFSGEFKAKVAFEAIRGEYTLSEIARKYKIHPNQVTQWKQQALSGLPEVFSKGNADQKQASEEEIKTLHAKIGELTVERDFLKKGLSR